MVRLKSKVLGASVIKAMSFICRYLCYEYAGRHAFGYSAAGL